MESLTFLVLLLILFALILLILATARIINILEAAYLGSDDDA